MGEILRYPWMELDNRLWRFMSIPIWLFYLLFYLITAVQLMQLLYHRYARNLSSLLLIFRSLLSLTLVFYFTLDTSSRRTIPLCWPLATSLPACGGFPDDFFLY